MHGGEMHEIKEKFQFVLGKWLQYCIPMYVHR